MAEQSNNPDGVGIPAGSKIGKYEVIERRAIGGQAVIYKGRDELLDRFVAIKQISTHLAEDPKFLERFRREAQILAKLSATQPAVVTIHEMIQDERGLFIVMQWVEGPSLEQILAEHPEPMETKAALQLIWRLAAAMYDVHAAGIIHRDVKPANIIVCQGLHPKIADFGVAATSSGQSSMVLGTTKYMAPELFEGSAVDARADMYSMGMMAYEMLAGREKFNEVFADIVRDPHSASLRWMKWHGDNDQTAPPLAEVNPAVPENLSDIVEKMMAKDPDQRFASMEELGRAIKTTFSPKRGGAAKAAPAAGASTRSHRRRSSGPGAAEQEKLGPGDAADQLELEADETPTAEIPARKMSLKSKIIAAVVVFLLVLGGAVAAVVYVQQQRAKKGADAKTLLAEAQNLYRQADSAAEYAAASEAFMKVPDAYPQSRLAPRARVLAAMAEARGILEQAGDLENWQRQATDAQQRAEEILGSGKITDRDWLDEMDRRIEDFEATIHATTVFLQAVDVAETRLADEEFAKAADALTRGPISSVKLNASQKLRVQHLLAEIDRQEFLAAYRQRLREADVLAEQARDTGEIERFDQAAAAYRRAEKFLAGSGQKVAPETRQQFRQDIDTKTKALALQRAFQEAYQAGEAALAAGDKNEAVAQFRKAMGFGDTGDLQQRIDRLRAEILYEQGMTLLAEGKYEQARAKLDEGLKIRPDHSAIKQAIEQIETGSRRRLLVAEGEEAFAANQWEKARQRFQAANAIEADEALQAKIRECEYQLHLAEAERLQEAGEYDAAAAAYEKARSVKPAAGAMIDTRLSAMAQQQQYEKWMAAGKAAVATKKWKEAQDAYERAKEIRNTPEANRGIAMAKYGSYLQRGKRAMQQEDYDGALGYFELARGHMETEEVKQLIQRVREMKGE